MFQIQGGGNPAASDAWILSGTNASIAILATQTFHVAASIPSADWLHDFIRPWRGDRFVVYEIPEAHIASPATAAQSDFVDHLESARKTLTDARERLDRGDWTDVPEKLRGVFELLREESMIKDLLVRSGYPADAVDNMVATFKAQFDLGAKFLHKLDRGKKLRPDIVAEREDAHLVYGIAAAAVFLLCEKLRRFGVEQP